VKIEPIHILIGEDNRILRDSIVQAISKEADIQIVAAVDSDFDRTKIIALQPDVILIDISLNHLDCQHIVNFIHEQIPGSKTILFDLAPQHSEVIEFVRLGVSGFILKDASVEDLMKTLQSVAAGGKILPSSLIDTLFTEIMQGMGKTEILRIKDLADITRREQEIIGKLAQGLSNKEIANVLNISVDTIKSHVHNILEKLSLQRRSQIAAYLHKYEIMKTKLSSL
jgi:DNA-binding NarL/FixJ family response regulator